MTLPLIIALMILAMYLGKNSKEFRFRQIVIVALIAMVQLVVILVDVYTRQIPR